MRPLASRMSVMSGEGALSVFAHAKELERQGRSIIHLELGEPDFHPAEPVIDALQKAVREGKDRYCPVAGLPALREELAIYLRQTRNALAAALAEMISMGELTEAGALNLAHGYLHDNAVRIYGGKVQ